MTFWEILSNEYVRTSSEMLTILSCAKTHAIDIVQKWRLDTTHFPVRKQLCPISGQNFWTGLLDFQTMHVRTNRKQIKFLKTLISKPQDLITNSKFQLRPLARLATFPSRKQNSDVPEAHVP